MSWLHRLLGSDGITQLYIEPYRKSARVAMVKRGEGFSIEALTGSIAAASNGSVFAMRNSPTSGKDVYISYIALEYNTITAFTVPVTQRRLQIIRGSGAAASGGSAITPIAQHDSADASSQLNAANGGDVRVSTTATLTVTGITFDTNAVSNFVLTQFGAANARNSKIFDFGSTDKGSLVLQPGELLAVRTSAAFDAAGTWQLGIEVSGWQVTPGAGE
jgi:hypothetical protein